MSHFLKKFDKVLTLEWTDKRMQLIQKL